MIIRDLLIKLGVRSDLAGLDHADRQIAKTTELGRNLGDVMSVAMGQLAAQAVTAFVSELREATEASLEFQRTLGQIQSLIPGNVTRAKEYRQEIGRLAVEFGRSAKDLGEGVYDVLSTFGDTADNVKMLEIATKAGAAGNATTGDGIAVLTAVTKAYGDTSVQTAQKVSDLAFQTVNLGVIKLPELASSLGRATPLAATLGVEMEELFAVIASATGVTGGGAEVLTQMASLMRGLLDRSKEAQAAFKKAFKGDKTVKTMEQAIGKRGLIGTVQALAAQTDGSAESLNKLFGRAEATTLALQLTGKGAADFASKLQAMKQWAGASDTAFDAMTGGMAKGAQDVAVAKAQTEQYRLELGDNLIPKLSQWHGLQGEIYKSMNETLIPMLQDPTFFAFAEDVSVIGEAFKALQFVIAMVANAIDTVVTGMRQAIALGRAGLEIVDPRMWFGSTQDQAEAGDRAAAHLQAGTDAGAAAMQRIARRTQIAFGEKSSADWNRVGESARADLAAERASRAADLAAERASRAASFGRNAASARSSLAGNVGGAGGIFNALMGGVTVNVQVPEGTTASASARIGDTGARVLLQQFLDGAARAFPSATPAAAGQSDW